MEDILSIYGNSSFYQGDNTLNTAAIYAKDASIYTADNKLIIDLSSGGFGYGQGKILDAIEGQLDKVALSSRILVSRPLALLVKAIAELAPGDLDVSYICNSPEEAFDSALKLLKGLYPTKRKIITMKGAYHGSFTNSLCLAGMAKDCNSISSFESIEIDCNDIESVDKYLDKSVAAIVIESATFNNGITVPTKDFLSKVRKITEVTGSLMIVDETNTELGRTGTCFYIENHGIVPDVLVFGESLGGSAISIGCYVTKKSINDKLYNRKNPTLHGSTTGANPLCCAAANAVVEIVSTKEYWSHIAQKSKLLHSSLDRLKREVNCIESTTVTGLLASICFAENVDARLLVEMCKREGVLLDVREERNNLYLKPPLMISDNELIEGIERIKKVLAGEKRTLKHSNNKPVEVVV